MRQNPNSNARRLPAAIFCCSVALLVLLTPGCVSQGRARAQAAAAYKAGQQEALTRMHQTQAEPDSVRINGPVRQPILPWTPNMTLGTALVAAEYLGAEPQTIYIVRQGRAFQVDPKELLAGKDQPLLSGDIIQIQTAGPPP